MAGKSPRQGSSSDQTKKIEKPAKESEVARHREEQVIFVRGMFSNYGHSVANHLVNEFVRYGHLKNTLRHLNTVQPEDLGQQCDLIIRHIEQVGPNSLLMHSAHQSKPGKSSDAKDIDTSELGEQILDEAESRLMERVLKKPAKSKPSNQDSTAQKSKMQNWLEDDDLDAAEPAATAPPAPPDVPPDLPPGVEICPKTGRPMKDGKYIERRSGVDRRQQKDRRGNLEVVFKNRRFGGDRRSNVDRRKNPWTPPDKNNQS